jgi:hypothetical protein
MEQPMIQRHFKLLPLLHWQPESASSMFLIRR